MKNISNGNLYLTTEQVQQLKDDGYLNDTQVSNIDRIESSWNQKRNNSKLCLSDSLV